MMASAAKEDRRRYQTELEAAKAQLEATQARVEEAERENQKLVLLTILHCSARAYLLY